MNPRLQTPVAAGLDYELSADDEWMHPLEEASNFNESMYFNLFDPDKRRGGWFRLGNRANEGYAEMTVCLYDSDGSVYFNYAKPQIDDNNGFAAGGLSFTVAEPIERLHIRYEGQLVHLADPVQMEDPGRAFKHNPWLDSRIELEIRGLSPLFGGEPAAASDANWMQNDDGFGGFSRGHYEQHIAGSGTIQLGDTLWAHQGFGLRDHSWGPRYWQSPYWYRWLTIAFGEDLGAMITILTDRSGQQKRHGLLYRDGHYEEIVDARITSDWQGESRYQAGCRAWAQLASGEELEISGTTQALIPLRNRRQAQDGSWYTTRIVEAMSEWRLGDRVGYGMAEYLDQMVAGRPVGD